MRKKLVHKKKNKSNFSCQNGHNPIFKKKGNCFICGRSSHHEPHCRHKVKNDNLPKTNKSKEEETTIVVISHVNLMVNMSISFNDFYILYGWCMICSIYLMKSYIRVSSGVACITYWQDL